MACYHFRIKSDKKPGGLRIAASAHIEYVNREGKYKNIDNRQALGSVRSFRNFISGEHPITELPEKPMLLYSSPFGKIALDAKGVHVSQHASVETAAIALRVAQKIFGDEVTANGNAAFERQLVFATNELGLGAHFSNTELEIAAENDRREREEREREAEIVEGLARSSGRRSERRGRESGRSEGSGARVFGIGGSGGHGRDADRSARDAVGLAAGALPDIAERTKKAFAPSFHLHVLPAGRMDPQGRKPRVLLPPDVGTELLDERGRRDSHFALRRAFASKRLKDVEAAADSVLSILQKNETGDFAFSHLQYINREAAFAQRGGCSMTGNHLPAWANGSALRFFHAADRFERSNGERYKEIVFSLPNELSVEQSKEILDRFLEKHLKHHYYAWAIHEKVGAMSIGERHPHVHLMFSTREIDETERRKERMPERFFSRANKKNPEKGGCPKAAKWNDKNRAKHLFLLREDFARIQNDVLKQHGVPSRVNFLSLAVQKDAAERRGDYVLAEMLDRIPEHPTNPISIVRDDDLVRQQKQLRLFNDKRLEAILRRTLASDAKKEAAMASAEEKAASVAERLLGEDLSELGEGERAKLEASRKALEARCDEMRAKKAALVWGREALEEARLEWLGEDGREAWERTMQLRRDLHEQKRFWMELERAEDATLDEKVAFDEVEEAIGRRITELEREYKAAAKKLQPHLKKLASRTVQKSLPYRVNEMLFQSELPKQRYGKSIRDLEAATRRFQRDLDEARARRFEPARSPDEMREDLSMTLAEVKRLIGVARRYRDRDIRRKREELQEAQKNVYSFERIILIAENIFEGGGVKRLRDDTRKHEKEAAHFRSKLEDFERRKAAFKEKPETQSPAYLRERAALQRDLAELNAWRAELNEARRSLDIRREAIERRRDTPEAEVKVQRIAAGILKKNRPAVEHAKKIAAELKALQQDRDALLREDAAVEHEIKTTGGGRYKPVRASSGGGGGGGGKEPPSRIENARMIAGGLAMQHGALIARAREDRTLEENWALVSDMEKDAILEEEARGR